jgi:hypothetical protein
MYFCALATDVVVEWAKTLSKGPMDWGFESQEYEDEYEYA